MNFWERNNFNSQNGMNNNSFNNAYGNNGAFNNANGGFATQGNNGTQCGADGVDEQVRARFEQYEGKSEDQLMSELASTVARMKKDGTFDATAMENLYNTALPFLNDTQRQRMRAIIDMFKG